MVKLQLGIIGRMKLLVHVFLLFFITQAPADEKNILPDLGGAPAANTASVQPNINGQGAGFNYLDTIDGKLININSQYTKKNGVAVGCSLASTLSKNIAAGILLTAGSDKNEWLLNAGFDLSHNQRFIFSLGQLRQKLDFNFISGRQKTSVKQDNIAASYQYLLGKDWLNAAEVNAYLSNTGSITLGDKTYFIDTSSLYELWNDPRRIVGGRVTGMQVRLALTPTSKTNIKVGLGIERLTYNYSTGDESTNRATGSAELMHHLANGFNFRASINAASSQNRYALGLDRTFKDGAQLSIDVARIEGRDNTFDDTQLLLSYTKGFGAGQEGRQAGMGIGLNSDTPMEPASLSTALDNAATSNQAINTWSTRLVNQVSQRPSFLPSQVVAKIDTTATPTRLIVINKLAIPAESTIDNATGVITSPTGTAVSGIADVTKNTLAFVNSGQFTLSGNDALVIKPSLITQPVVGVIDTYVVTMNNSAGGGTTLATVKVSHSSTSIDSIEIATGIIVINTVAIAGVTSPELGATPVTTVSGTVTWSGSPSTFAASTVYTATVTLTAASGYTLTGVAANYFTVNGATATNAVNSGVVSAVFPATLTPVSSSAYAEGYRFINGLTWSPNNDTYQAPHYTTYANGKITCDNMSIANTLGSNTWRVPTPNELLALFSGGTSTLTSPKWLLGNTLGREAGSVAAESYYLDLSTGVGNSLKAHQNALITCVY